MKIGNICTKSNIFLAPMAGVSDVGLRFLAKEYGAGLTCTEMISAKALIFKSKKTAEMLETSHNEDIKVVQLFGSSPAEMAMACSNPLLDKFDIIDINMGCPAPKVVKNGEGSALLENPLLASEIIIACVRASKGKPITVKFRIGVDDNYKNYIQFAQMCEKSGASAICVHGRTREQGYSGKVDYDAIKKIKESVKIPVIGNGDIIDESSYNKMLDTGVDAVMIGRGALGEPEIFAELQNMSIQHSKLWQVEKHIELLRKNHNEKFVMLNMRKHFLWYMKNMNCKKEKLQIVQANTLEEALEIFKKVIKEQNV